MQVCEAHAGQRLDRFLAEHLTDHSRSRLATWIREGRVRVDAVVELRPSAALRVGTRVDIDVPDAPAPTLVGEAMPLEIVHEDEDLVVLVKAAGVVVHPGAGHAFGTLVQGLLNRYGTLSPVGAPSRPGIVHRIDRGTSGLLVVARTERAHHDLAAQFAQHSVDRRYWAIAWDRALGDTGTVSGPYGRHPTERTRFSGRVQAGKRAVTHWRVLERLPPCVWLECRLETGRTHQIRVHMAEQGCPLVGDATYGQQRRVERPQSLARLGPDLGLGRQALHAFRLGFRHPTSGAQLTFDAPMPPELESLLQALRSAVG